MMRTSSRPPRPLHFESLRPRRMIRVLFLAARRASEGHPERPGGRWGGLGGTDITTVKAAAAASGPPPRRSLHP
jgi:hypothetical protein